MVLLLRWTELLLFIAWLRLTVLLLLLRATVAFELRLFVDTCDLVPVEDVPVR